MRRCWTHGAAAGHSSQAPVPSCSSVTHTLCPVRSSIPAGLDPLSWASCCPYHPCDTQPLRRAVRCRCRVVPGRLVGEAGLCVIGLGSLDQGHPGRTASCDPRNKIALSLLCICRQLCSDSEMPTPIKREMSNLCWLRICILAVTFVFDFPVSTSSKRLTKITVEVSGACEKSSRILFLNINSTSEAFIQRVTQTWETAR